MNEFIHFVCLSVSRPLTDDDRLGYTQHLEMIKVDEEIRFRDRQNLEVPAWILQPYQVSVCKKEAGLQNDEEAQADICGKNMRDWSDVIFSSHLKFGFSFFIVRDHQNDRKGQKHSNLS